MSQPDDPAEAYAKWRIWKTVAWPLAAVGCGNKLADREGLRTAGAARLGGGTGTLGLDELAIYSPDIEWINAETTASTI
jgi:hypothetical protein